MRFWAGRLRETVCGHRFAAAVMYLEVSSMHSVESLVLDVNVVGACQKQWIHRNLLRIRTVGKNNVWCGTKPISFIMLLIQSILGR